MICVSPPGEGQNIGVSVVINLQTSPANGNAIVSYYGPTVNNAVPQNGPTGGQTPVTINGANFGIGDGTVTIGGGACQSTSWKSYRIVCTLPSGVGKGNLVIVTVAGIASNSSLYAYAPPTISSISPNHTDCGGGGNVVITGSNFGAVPAQSSVIDSYWIALRGKLTADCRVVGLAGHYRWRDVCPYRHRFRPNNDHMPDSPWPGPQTACDRHYRWPVSNG